MYHIKAVLRKIKRNKIKINFLQNSQGRLEFDLHHFYSILYYTYVYYKVVVFDLKLQGLWLSKADFFF